MKNLYIVALIFGYAACIIANSVRAEQGREAGANISGLMLNRLCPQPKEAAFFDGEYLLDEKSRVTISMPNEVSKEERSDIGAIFLKYWKFIPQLEFVKKAENANLGEEGYLINIGGGIGIDAKDIIGLKQSLKTLRQLAEACRDGRGYAFQHASIKDYAALKFRGMHICIFPETTLEQLEKYIRLAGYYKFNYLIIEPWGVFPFKSHPEFAYAEKKLDRKKFKKLIELCYELGITPIPQLSILGHASQSRVNTVKHAVLANHPEFENIFETYGWSYCMSSRRAESILMDLITEIYDFYGKPPFFHLGCDEAYDMGSCYECRKHDIANLLLSHITKFNKYINKLGARSIIWHDMFLDSADPRWEKHVAMGNAKSAKALASLPKNIIIADWQYSLKDKNMAKFASPMHFKDAGYEVIVCPWETNKGIVSLAKTAKEEKLFGFLSTTWHRMHDLRKNFSFFYAAGDAAWNGGNSLPRKFNDARMAMLKHMWQIGSDIKDLSYEANGISKNQISLSISD